MVAENQERKDKEGGPVVSVVIPSYNSASYIRECLRALRAQRTELPFEVILIDSSDDGTDRIVADEFPEIRLFHFPQRCSVGRARNIGIEKARGEIVLFLDTDCITKPTWIEEMCSAIQRFGADGVCGSLENGTPWNLAGTTGFYLEFFRFLPFDGKPQPTPFLVGGNSGFRREVFRSIRYHDASVGDDFTLSWQLATQGKRLLFLPAVSVLHLNKTGWRKILGYQYKLGMAACSYRSRTSPNLIRCLEKFSILAFLMPLAVLPWIGFVVLRRRGVLEFLKFTVLLPSLYLANNVWAWGFYQALKNRQRERKRVIAKAKKTYSAVSEKVKAD
jgi:glycosyltransferase involved in cell wall biosynthesis